MKGGKIMLQAKLLDFLFENRLNDSKVWFGEHREEYKEFVEAPVKELSQALLPVITGIDDKIDKVHVSRIYRDARFCKGKSIFRENMWCSYSRVKDLYKALPAFYFDISANGFEYGCGFYSASTECMNALREMILANSPLYAEAEEALKKQRTFELYGDMFKRDRYPEESEEKKKWLNRKTVGVTALLTDWELIFSDKLAAKVGRDFKKIAPVYKFILQAGEMGQKLTEEKD
ncbi:MAG: DUF2461 domain-containing protein [Oscillospiraceae bacterium]|nr:DUF2461 domain-containing protein [Oscillospiraceae bacterium]